MQTASWYTWVHGSEPPTSVRLRLLCVDFPGLGWPCPDTDFLTVVASRANIVDTKVWAAVHITPAASGPTAAPLSSVFCSCPYQCLLSLAAPTRVLLSQRSTSLYLPGRERPKLHVIGQAAVTSLLPHLGSGSILFWANYGELMGREQHSGWTAASCGCSGLCCLRPPIFPGVADRAGTGLGVKLQQGPGSGTGRRGFGTAAPYSALHVSLGLGLKQCCLADSF